MSAAIAVSCPVAIAALLRARSDRARPAIRSWAVQTRRRAGISPAGQPRLVTGAPPPAPLCPPRQSPPRRVVVELEDPPPTDPSEEDIAAAERFAVLHRPIAVPGKDACVWCGQPWPCAYRRWADAVLHAAGRDGGDRP